MIDKELLKKYQNKPSPPLLEGYWYILDIKNLTNPRLLNNKFKDVEIAKRAIRQELGWNFFRFRCIRGELALKHNLKFKRNKYKSRAESGVRDYKYEYPKGAIGDKRAMIRFRDNTRYKLKKQRENENNNF